MKTKLGLLVAVLLLGYGIIRIGVGGALLAQDLGIVNFPDLIEATSDVREFFDARVDKQLIPFTLAGYFAYILVMGILLTTGAVGAIIRKKWGYVVLWIYIASHAALFINYQEVNPKLFVLALQILLLYGLKYLIPPKKTEKNTMVYG